MNRRSFLTGALGAAAAAPAAATAAAETGSGPRGGDLNAAELG